MVAFSLYSMNIKAREREISVRWEGKQTRAQIYIIHLLISTGETAASTLNTSILLTDRALSWRPSVA